jgi:ribosomal protein S18 acetylase RimI-like enzyme
VAENIDIREVEPGEYELLGELAVEVYSNIEGFPAPAELPDYYEMLTNIGSLNEEKDFKVLVAETVGKEIAGGIVYCGNMARYGAPGTATQEKHASGIRLLCVDPEFRGSGVGRALTDACISLARSNRHRQVILHTTQAMQIAWGLYQKMGFERSSDLDFTKDDLGVYGFRLRLDE